MHRCAILQPEDNTGALSHPGQHRAQVCARRLHLPAHSGRHVLWPRPAPLPTPHALPRPFGPCSAPLGCAGRRAAREGPRRPSLPSSPPPSRSPRAGGAAAAHRGLAPRLCLPRPPPAARAALCGAAAAQHGRDGVAARGAVPAEPAGDLGERVLAFLLHPVRRWAPGGSESGGRPAGFAFGSAHLFPLGVAGGARGAGGRS